MQEIKEEDGIHKSWIKQKPKNTTELKEFIDSLLNDYGHDYGTIIHAMVAAMMATMWTIDKSPQGGITGFQASAIWWELAEHLTSFKRPCRILDFNNMLYPQYQDDFEKRISQNAFEHLQTEAKKMLGNEQRARADLKKHWQSIVDGKIPFGYTVEKD